MIDVDEEIKKFEPSLEVGDVEKAINADDFTDVMEILETFLKLLAQKGR